MTLLEWWNETGPYERMDFLMQPCMNCRECPAASECPEAHKAKKSTAYLLFKISQVCKEADNDGEEQ